MFGTWPNIRGAFTREIRSENAGAIGAFSSTTPGTIAYQTIEDDSMQEISFSAFNSNSTYSGTTVQPPALYALPCIRC